MFFSLWPSFWSAITTHQKSEHKTFWPRYAQITVILLLLFSYGMRYQTKISNNLQLVLGSVEIFMKKVKEKKRKKMNSGQNKRESIQWTMDILHVNIGCFNVYWVRIQNLYRFARCTLHGNILNSSYIECERYRLHKHCHTYLHKCQNCLCFVIVLRSNA